MFMSVLNQIKGLRDWRFPDSVDVNTDTARLKQSQVTQFQTSAVLKNINYIF